ncbi:hypothetical protein [Pseudomonas syringae]|uniref:hypothetical protein n=1 Tax=Pseudomonas syringae TaxID=317 RepID=UPI000F00AC4E|nr:hypothetical protein [Pseudomonas syringae]
MPQTKSAHEVKLDDIKSFFDGIKNILVCASLAIALTYLQDPMAELGMGYRERACVNWALTALIAGLSCFAIMWLWHNLKTKPSNGWFHAFSFFFLIAIGLVTFVSVFLYSHADIAFAPWR